MITSHRGSLPENLVSQFSSNLCLKSNNLPIGGFLKSHSRFIGILINFFTLFCLYLSAKTNFQKYREIEKLTWNESSVKIGLCFCTTILMLKSNQQVLKLCSAEVKFLPIAIVYKQFL